MTKNKRNQRVEVKIFRGVGYLLLVGAAFCTMIPLLWLLTSSFKTANEIFAVPIQWFPSFPPRVASSPYIVENAYPKIEKPTAVDETVWETLQPELTQAIWEETQTHIASKWEAFQLRAIRRICRPEITEGLWQQLVASLPDEVWNGTTVSIVTAVQDAIIPEAVDTIWSSVYREVAVGTLQIEDLDFNRTPIEVMDWEAKAGTRIRPSDDAQTAASLSYDFQDNNTTYMTATVASPIPDRSDTTYHAACTWRCFVSSSVFSRICRQRDDVSADTSFRFGERFVERCGVATPTAFRVSWSHHTLQCSQWQRATQFNPL